jgi:hypothetical protein
MGMTDHSSEDWPEAPGYRYGREALLPALIIGIAAGVGASLCLAAGATGLIAWALPGIVPPRVALGLLARQGALPVLPLALLVVGLIDVALAVWLVTKILRPLRPLAINERGVYAWFRDRPWRFLAWRDISAVSKLRRIEPKYRRELISIEIAGPDFSLSMKPQISGFAEACRVLTREARRHGVRLQFIDKSKNPAGEVSPLAEL